MVCPQHGPSYVFNKWPICHIGRTAVASQDTAISRANKSITLIFCLWTGCRWLSSALGQQPQNGHLIWTNLIHLTGWNHRSFVRRFEFGYRVKFPPSSQQQQQQWTGWPSVWLTRRRNNSSVYPLMDKPTNWKVLFPRLLKCRPFRRPLNGSRSFYLNR